MSLGAGSDMSDARSRKYDIDLTMNDAKGEGTIHFSPTSADGEDAARSTGHAGPEAEGRVQGGRPAKG
jgi:hypothetical protein